MRRRAFIAALPGAALSFSAWAKESARIAVLGSGREDAGLSIDQMTWLRSGLRGVGLIEGQDFTFEARWADGDYDRFRHLAAELIGKQPAAIVVSTIAAAEAAREVSKTTPIVMTGLNDPVGAGLATSLARPGGNITGMATMNEEVILKLLGLVPSVLPRQSALLRCLIRQTRQTRPCWLNLGKRLLDWDFWSKQLRSQRRVLSTTLLKP